MSMQFDERGNSGIYPYADEWPRLLKNGALTEERRSVRAEFRFACVQFGSALYEACHEFKFNLLGAVRIAQSARQGPGRHSSGSRRWWRSADMAE